MEQTLENLLVRHAWREKRKTSSWPDEHALWSQLCCASYGASFKTLNCVCSQDQPAHPWLQRLGARSVTEVPVAIMAHMPYRGVVMGTKGGGKKYIYKYCTDWSPEPVTAACQAYSERYSKSASLPSIFYTSSPNRNLYRTLSDASLIKYCRGMLPFRLHLFKLPCTK